MVTRLIERRPSNVRRRPPLATRITAWWRRRRSERSAAAATAATLDGDEDADHWVDESPLMGMRVAAAVVAAVCVALLVGLFVSFDGFADRTRQFQVRDFAVRGNDRVADQALIAASGVRAGDGLMALDTALIRDRLEKLPWVRRADVATDLPARLIIQVVEYEPVALVADSGRLWLVDRDGVLFKTIDVGEACDLPILTGLDVPVLRDAKTSLQARELARRQLHQLLGLIDVHGRHAIAGRLPLSELHWDPVLGVSLMSTLDGAEVRLGHGRLADLGHAFDQIVALYDYVEQRGEWLEYALLDDDAHPDRTVVHTRPAAPLGGAGAEPSAARQAGGAAMAQPPRQPAKAARPTHRPKRHEATGSPDGDKPAGTSNDR